MIEGFEQMLSGSLRLEEPWHVTGAEFDSNRHEVHIHVGVRKDVAIPCPKCGGSTTRYGYEPTERKWRHSDCLFYPCYVHCQRPRVLCEHCGVQQLNASFERPNSRFTLLFEGYAMMIMADVPRRKASELLRCDEKSLASILSYWVTEAVEEQDLSDVSRIAIDETSFKRGHDYVTVSVDADEKRVFDVQPGRTKEAVVAMKKELERHGGDSEKIQSITCDMSSSYLPNAKQVIDKFHVKKLLIDALDKIRKQEQREVDEKQGIFRARRLFMIPEAKMTEDQRTYIAELSSSYPKTGRAFRIVQSLDLFYAANNEEDASILFDHLCSWMCRCKLQPMKDAAKTLKNHRVEILNYFRDRITNAISEGINSMIQVAKRKARGFKTFEGFAAMIYLFAGKLKLACPKPFL